MVQCIVQGLAVEKFPVIDVTFEGHSRSSEITAVRQLTASHSQWRQISMEQGIRRDMCTGHVPQIHCVQKKHPLTFSFISL